MADVLIDTPPPAPSKLYRIGCCVQCGKKIRNPEKMTPIFLIPDPIGEDATGPVYLHRQCEDAYNGTDKETV